MSINVGINRFVPQGFNIIYVGGEGVSLKRIFPAGPSNDLPLEFVNRPDLEFVDRPDLEHVDR